MVDRFACFQIRRVFRAVPDPFGPRIATAPARTVDRQRHIPINYRFAKSGCRQRAALVTISIASIQRTTTPAYKLAAFSLLQAQGLSYWPGRRIPTSAASLEERPRELLLPSGSSFST
ncbi:hypothetical protein GWC77_26375 [Paraburkholderia sp. NMBU_R16]|uniref:hypothetical protein n=1 Tax=Paraburkholderia sp. NMBU_R16 TaxID=2698676 RepID=UPI0015642A23|nr:hypothetical protein [Paraburkholderia sp. NMBU_R16]NRO99413.1 hypothetical protein [Paraburkholderia sp. NMBU_R16]